MKIESLKQLDKLMLLCRKRGIQSITIDGVTFHMGDLPEKAVYSTKTQATGALNSTSSGLISPGGITEATKIETDGLTDDQLLYYSARPEAFESQQ